MLATELIRKLQEIVDREGDLPVCIDDPEAQVQPLRGLTIEPSDRKEKLPRRIMLSIYP